MRAGIYCRISKDRRDSGGEFTMLGIDRQAEDCRGLCGALGWEVAEVYVDNDISAATGRVRPAYQRLLADIQVGRIEAIVCWHPDRLYRRVVDLEELVAVCSTRRVAIATVNAGHVDLATPTGQLVAGLLAQVAKYEGAHKAERWQRAWDQRRRAGSPATSGPRTYGYTRDGQIVQGEADQIRGWVRRRLEGESYYSISKTALGVTTRGNAWSATSIRQLLENPRLAGWVTVRGEVVARSEWPPILSDEDSAALRQR